MPFVVVVTGALLPRHEVSPLLSLKGKQGFTTMDAEDLARFAPTVELPAAAVYLATGWPDGGRSRWTRGSPSLCTTRSC